MVHSIWAKSKASWALDERLCMDCHAARGRGSHYRSARKQKKLICTYNHLASTWVRKAYTKVTALPTCSTLSRRSSSCSCCRGVTGWSARRTSDVGAVSRPSCRRRSCCCCQAEKRDPTVQTASSALQILRTSSVPAVSTAAAARQRRAVSNHSPLSRAGQPYPQRSFRSWLLLCP